MNRQPKISVIVPVYKAEKYLHRCIDSLLAQTFTDFEVLLIDDGSPDRSGEICDEYAAKDSRVQVFHKENGGQSSARNYALERIQGEYVFFLDSDDEIPPHALETCYKKSTQYRTDILAYKFGFIDKDSNPIKGYDNDYLPNIIYSGPEFLKKFTIVGAMCMYFYSHAFLKKNSLRLLEGIYREDEDFVTKAIAVAKNILYTNDVIYLYRKNPYSTTQVKSIERKILLLFCTLQVLESLNLFLKNGDVPQQAFQGIQKKMESLAVSFLQEFFCIKKFLSTEQATDALCRLYAIHLLPLKIKEHGLKYRLFALFANSRIRLSGICIAERKNQ